MDTPEAASFGGALITTALIGRERELGKIRYALGRAAGKEFRCVLIEADGGMGKTRLLREVSALLSARPELDPQPASAQRWRYPNVVAIPLIDVADPHLHTIVPFLRAVREGLRAVPKLSMSRDFATFDKAVEAYDQARDGEQPFGEVAKLRNEVIERFELAYAALARRRRVVWVIDTFEQLFRSRQEIESLFDVGEVIERPREQLSSSWLRDFIGALPQNTTLILAGRPKPQRWSAEVVAVVGTALIPPGRLDATPPPESAEDLRATLAISPTAIDTSPETTRALTQFTLKNFDAQQIRTYLEALHTQLQARTDLASLARYLHDNFLKDPDQPKIIYLLTEGNPIRLAIYIDLLLSSDTDPQAFRVDYAALGAMSLDTQRQVQQGLDSALLSYLSDNLSSPEHQVIELLAIFRRGLDLERLCAIWNNDRELAARTMRNLLRLSFVKWRWKSVTHASHDRAPNPAEIRVFLHDEFYAIYQRSFLREPPALLEERRLSQQERFQKLIKFCEQEFKLCVRLIPPMLAKLTTITARFSEEKYKPLPEELSDYASLKEQLRTLRHERRQLRTEQLHYELFSGPHSAFYERYFRRTEQAFSANASEHDAELQSEADLFFFGTTEAENGLQAGLSPDAWNELRYAMILQQVSGWLKRLMSYGKYSDARKLAAKALRTFVKTVEQWYPQWVATVRQSQAGKQIEYLYRLEWEANGAFAAVFEGQRVRETITTLERVKSDLEVALETFGTAAKTPELPGLEDVVALTLEQQRRFRNVVGQCLLFIGYAYATLSQFGTARRYYLDAIKVVEETGFQTLRAEIKNDLSRVLGELGDLTQAQRTCQEGLAIRRARGFDYLQALSLNTMALIYSRNWLPLKARVWSEEALSLFRQLDEPRGIGLALTQVAEARRRTASLLIGEAQLLRADHSSTRLPLSQLAISRAERDFQIATDLLSEAEEIFSEPDPALRHQPATVRDVKRAPELVRRLEVVTERAALYRDWSTVRGEGASGEKYQAALHALDAVISLTQPVQHQPDEPPVDDYAKFRLAALVNKAGLYQRARDHEAVKATLVAAELLIEPGYRLNKDRPLELNPTEVKEVFFRELGRIESIRAAFELDIEDDEPEIRHYVLAMTYFQLYSPFEMPYLSLARRRLSTLLDYLRESYGSDAQLRDIISAVIRDYHLLTLTDYFTARDDLFQNGPRTSLAVQLLLNT